MKQIKNRAVGAYLLVGLILAGLAFFLFRLAQNGSEWASYSANRHVYSSGRLRSGTVTDRNGVVLCRIENGKYTYAEDEEVRRASLHALGDHRGFLGAGALRLYADSLSGYSFVNGTPGTGTTLALSLDAELQKTALEALGKKTGGVILMNYETGEILCMVSAPSYDPRNDPDLSVDGVLLNRCTQSAYTPGSIYKTLTLAAAYENIPDLQERVFNCKRKMDVGGDTVVCNGKHGEQTIEQALANSCNICFGSLALELGGETLSEYAARYGLSGQLSLDGAYTTPGRFDIAASGTFDEAWSGIGQSTDLVTAYAMCRYAAAIANGGTIFEPTMRLGGGGSETQLMREDTASFVRDCLSYDVVYGYGRDRFPGLDLCAKSGTAEIGDGSTNAWFFGCLQSGPPIAFAVVLERGGSGLTRAGNAANKVLQKAVEIWDND